MPRTGNTPNRTYYHYKVIDSNNNNTFFFLTLREMEIVYNVSSPTISRKIRDNSQGSYKLQNLQFFKIHEPVFKQVLNWPE